MKLTEQEKGYLSIMPTTHLRVLRDSITLSLVLATEDTCRCIDETLAQRGERVVSREIVQ